MRKFIALPILLGVGLLLFAVCAEAGPLKGGKAGMGGPGKAFFRFLTLLDKLEVSDQQFSALRATFRSFRQDMTRIKHHQKRLQERFHHFLLSDGDAQIALEITAKMGKLAERRTATIIQAVGEAHRILTPQQWRKIRMFLVRQGKNQGKKNRRFPPRVRPDLVPPRFRDEPPPLNRRDAPPLPRRYKRGEGPNDILIPAPDRSYRPDRQFGPAPQSGDNHYQTPDRDFRPDRPFGPPPHFPPPDNRQQE